MNHSKLRALSFLFAFILTIVSVFYGQLPPRAVAIQAPAQYYILIETREALDLPGKNPMNSEFQGHGITILEIIGPVLAVKGDAENLSHFLEGLGRDFVVRAHLLPLYGEEELFARNSPQIRQVVLRWNNEAKKAAALALDREIQKEPGETEEEIDGRTAPRQEIRSEAGERIPAGMAVGTIAAEIDLLQEEKTKINGRLTSLKEERRQIGEFLKTFAGDPTEKTQLDKQRRSIEDEILALTQKLITLEREQGASAAAAKEIRPELVPWSVPSEKERRPALAPMSSPSDGEGRPALPSMSASSEKDGRKEFEIFLRSFNSMGRQGNFLNGDTQPNRALANGTISGKVTDSSDSGIPNVRVRVYNLSQSWMTDAYTNASGNFTLSIAAGTYRVFFDPSYYGLNYVSQWSNNKASFSAADDVSVTEGSTTANVNALLATGGIISGTVTNSSGTGIRNVSVRVYDQNATLIVSRSTDASGNYQLKGLASGAYRLYFSPSSLDGYLSQWHNNKASFSAADNVNVTAGSTTSGINAQLASGGIISGTVTSAASSGPAAAGTGIQSVYVSAYDEDDIWIVGASTDASGNYQLKGFASGAYRLHFSPSSSTNYLSQWYNNKASFSAADNVSVTAGSTTANINAQLAVGGIISGTVTSAASSSPAAAGTGIQYIRVKVWDAGQSYSSWNYYASVYTDSSGNYSINQLPAGNYKVYFDSYYYGGLNYLPLWYNNKASFSVADDVSVTAGSTKANINAQLVTGGIISGTVINSSGTGIQNVSVRAYDQNNTLFVSTSTDASGHYQLNGFATGAYRLYFSPPSSTDYLSQWYKNKASFSAADDVSVTAGSTTANINAQLVTGGIISGTVTSAASSGPTAAGTGIQNVYVSAYDQDKNWIVAIPTDASGNYQLKGLATGDYRIFFDTSYYDLNYLSQWHDNKASFSAADNVSVTAGSTTSNINAQLVTGATISGTVTSAASSGPAAAGTGIQYVRVKVWDASQTYSSHNYYSSIYTDASGNYSIKRLPSGNYKVYFDSYYYGGLNYLPQWYNNKASFSVADDVSVTAGSTKAGIDAQLAAGGIISGTVTNSSGTGIQNVSVDAYDQNGSRIFGASTDALGHYQLKGFATGAYRINFSTSLNYVSQWFNNKPSFSAADNVSVTEGSTTSNINAQLVTGGIISGTVTSAASSGPTAAGTGIQYVRVKVWNASQTYSSYNYYSSIYTDASGNYSINQLPAGSYKVYFDSYYYYGGLNYVHQWYNNKASFSAAGIVSVTAGSTTAGVNAQLAVGGIISGTVTSAASSGPAAAGTGIQSVYVQAYDQNNTSIISRQTDASGNYQLTGLAAGAYRINFSTSLNYVSQWFNNKPSFSAADNVSVTEGSTTSNINAQLVTGATISGTVTSAASSGPTAAGTGIQYVGVKVWDASQTYSSYNYYSSIYTDASGNYSINRLPAGSYKVYFDSYYYGGLNYVPQWYSNQANFSAAGLVSVTAGSTTANINAQLVTGGIISGTVTSAASSGPAASGTGIQNVYVRAYDQNNISIVSTSTDAEGNYQLKGFATGAYRIYFSTSTYNMNYFSQWYNNKTGFSAADNVSVTAGGTTAGINVQLEPAGAISGTVMSASSAGPAAAAAVSNVRVRIYSSTGSSIVSTTTNTSGIYTVNQLVSGTYMVYFDPSYNNLNYVPQWFNNKTNSGEADMVSVTVGGTTANVDAQLVTGGIIAGTVTDSSGAGLAGVLIRVYTQGDSQVPTYNSVVTDAVGNYQFRGLPTGRYHVYFDPTYDSLNSSPQYYNNKALITTADEISVTAGSTTSGINARLADAGSVTGTVTTASAAGSGAAGAGIQSVSVYLYYSSSTSIYKSTTTDVAGRYKFQGLPAGTYKVYFNTLPNRLNYAPRWYNNKSSFVTADNVTVTEGSTTANIDAQLAPGGTISGTITSASPSATEAEAAGSGLRYVYVDVYDQDLNFLTDASTDAEGKYQVKGLPTGAYRLKIYGYSTPTYKYVPVWYSGKSSYFEANNVNVIAGGDTPNIDAQLILGGTISGKVTGAPKPSGSGAAGTSTADAALYYAYVRILDKNGNQVATTYTASDGTYSTSYGLPAGNFRILFDNYYYYNPDYAAKFYGDVYDFSQASFVAVTQGGTTTADGRLEIGGKIQGTVNSAASAVQIAGLSNVYIYAVDKDNMTLGSRVYSAQDGTYTLPGLMTNDYIIRFGSYSSEYQYYNGKSTYVAADSVQATVGTTITGINATFAKGGAVVSGTVKNAAGQGIPNVYVRFYDGNGNVYFNSGYTGALGTFSTTVAAGTWKVLFDGQYSIDNYASQWHSGKSKFGQADGLLLTAGSSITGINATLVPGGGIKGGISGASVSGSSSSGLPMGAAGIEGATVYLKDEDNNVFLSKTTSGGGFYSLKGVPAGTYKVFFEPPARLSQEYGGVWFNGISSFGAADPVTVTAGVITPDINGVLPFGSSATISLSKKNLYYTATTTGSFSGSQQTVITASGYSVLTWSAASNAGWLACTPTSGTGTGAITVSVNPAGLAAGSYTGQISVTGNATNSPQAVSVALTVKGPETSLPPFGEFSTPIDNTTGITGAIPVTGWVVDDVEVVKVEVKRDPCTGDPPGAIGPDGLVFVGYGIFVEGARPDIETGYPGYPMNYKAGWGYMLLTNFLPNQGNGTYKLHAFATDKEGHLALLGSKTIVCSNATASKPFGTIDTPMQGGDASGNLFLNFGWVLTPMPKTVPIDGSTIDVFVDSVKIGNLATAPNVYNQYRVDVATAFPGLKNSGGPVGAFYLDTTKYANGVHTIFWIATDDAGAADGIGSRYFNVINTGTAAFELSHREERSDVAISTMESLSNLPPSFAPLRTKTGFNLNAEPEIVAPDNYGVFHVEIPEVDRLEIGVASTIYRKKVKNVDATPILSGYMIVGDVLRPLPIGSTLDARTGTFSWMPGPGFVGEYDLIFVVEDEFGNMRRISLNVRIIPKTGEIATSSRSRVMARMTRF